MSHQTGIAASDELKEFFAHATKKESNIRLIKVGIDNEQLVEIHHSEANGSYEEDYDNAILPVLEEKQPCYLFYRLDTISNLNGGYEWLFISYSPDNSEVRQKMLYAGTRSTVKMEFGGGLIVKEIFGTTKSDVNLDGYKKHVISETADAPLTIAEEEMREVKQQHLHASVTSTANTLPGIAFPIDDNAITELIRIAKKEITYVQLSLDVDNEIVNLEKACDIEVDQLASNIPSDTPRYHFFLFKHTHEGDYLESIVFIYSMPGYSCSVKERMLYSSCKAPLLSGVEDVLKMKIDKKLEIGTDDKLTAETLQDDLHPKVDIAKAKFAKPKGPGNRGPRRLIKPTKETPAENS